VVTSLYCHNHLVSLVMLDHQKNPLMRTDVKRREIWEWSDHTQFQHPTYRAIIELSKAIKTVFLCQYLHREAPASRDPRRLASHRELE
jgi:hypothetical protein